MMETLEGCVLEDWGRARLPSGVPYYVNHSLGVTQWDHPEYVRIMEEVLSANSVKYAAYRTACKLRRLQTRLKLNDVALQCVASAFDNAGLRAGENSDMVRVNQIEEVIHQILRATHKHRQVRVTLATHLTLNLLLNVFDQKRTGMVQVLGCKVLMVVLCGGRLQEKYRYLFSQVADHNNCCTRRRLAALLRDLARIPELLSEQPSFGVSFVPAAVESCFKEVGGEVGITEEVLLAWLLQEPQTLVWWTTLYRLTAAELVCHDVKCGVCKQRPIIGLRYQCLRCLGYNLCQDCFLHGRTSRRHKIFHPIQEYCHETTGKEWRRALLKILRHRLSSNRSESNKQRYLAIASNPETSSNLTSLLCDGGGEPWREDSCDDSDGEEELMSRTIMHSTEDLLSNRSSDSNSQDSGRGSRDIEDGPEPTILPNSPRHQIHSVIMHLQDGHRQLEDEGNGSGVKPTTVEQHTQQLQTQINRLKAILQAFNSVGGSKNIGSRSDNNQQCSKRGLPRLESTPIVGERGLLLNLSPISTQSSANDTAVLDNKENHFVENIPGTPDEKREGLRPLRMPFSPQDKNISSTSPVNPSTLDVGAGKNEHAAKLPSFTEVNFSDLTCLTSGTASGVASPTETENKRIEDCLDDDAAREVRQELENILKQLDHIFPLSESESDNPAVVDGGVVAAACELGDVLAEYVNAVPSCFIRDDHGSEEEADLSSHRGVK
ncbi:dystrophin-related protein 2-like isoform X2 [Macrobrachium nipponense]|uniref:dystrophin-related protein 2-like isoform X2 n=1 Tax=Macrobrachium nipponense TaxID=159736 RepID=UPI0030C7BF1C